MLPGCRCWPCYCHYAQQVLQDSYNGFVDSRIVDDFVNFSDVLFAAFGDRVKDWMTFNEPWITCALQVHTHPVVNCNCLHVAHTSVTSGS